MEKQILVFVNNIPMFHLIIEKTTTILALKHILKEYKGQIRMFLNPKLELKVFETKEYDNLTFESVWDDINNAVVEIFQTKFTGNKQTDLMVLQLLDDEDLKKACQTNQYFRDLCKDEGFWMNRTINLFHNQVPVDELKAYKGKSWKTYYKSLERFLFDPNKAAKFLLEHHERTDIYKLLKLKLPKNYQDRLLFFMK